MSESACRGRRDAGSGLVTLTGGLLVFLVFLLLATQLLVGLYGRSLVTSVASDAAQRAASQPQTPVEVIEADARGMLGRAGRSASFRWRRIDDDADGTEDTLRLTVVVTPPRLLPRWVSAGLLARIERTVDVRLETA